MREVFRNDYFSVEVDLGRGLAKLVRQSAPFPSLEVMARVYAELEPVLTRHTGLALLLDLRAGPPGRNDDAFESAIDRWRRKLGGFTRRAVLVRSMAGKLQVQRMGKKDQWSARVFTDEAEALRFLDEK